MPLVKIPVPSVPNASSGSVNVEPLINAYQVLEAVRVSFSLSSSIISGKLDEISAHAGLAVGPPLNKI